MSSRGPQVRRLPGLFSSCRFMFFARKSVCEGRCVRRELVSGAAAFALCSFAEIRVFTPPSKTTRRQRSGLHNFFTPSLTLSNRHLKESRLHSPRRRARCCRGGIPPLAPRRRTQALGLAPLPLLSPLEFGLGKQRQQHSTNRARKKKRFLRHTPPRHSASASGTSSERRGDAFVGRLSAKFCVAL